MANPSYPMSPQMQGMHPMQQQQQQGPPPAAPRPARGGTSRAVPVVVSAGLAVGVFCGLLFGLGTGEEDLASASTSASTTPDKPTDDEVKPIPSSLGRSPTPPSRPPPSIEGSGSAVATGTGSGTGLAAGTGAAPVAAGAGSGSAAGAASAPAHNKVTLTVELKPDSVAAAARITVDKAAITGTSTEIDLGSADKKDVMVVIDAKGFKPVEQKVTLEGDTTVKIELVKKPASAPATTTTTPRPRPPKPPKPKPGEGGGSLIDL